MYRLDRATKESYHFGFRRNARSVRTERAPKDRNLSARITFDFRRKTYLVTDRKLFLAPRRSFFAKHPGVEKLWFAHCSRSELPVEPFGAPVRYRGDTSEL